MTALSEQTPRIHDFEELLRLAKKYEDTDGPIGNVEYLDLVTPTGCVRCVQAVGYVDSHNDKGHPRWAGLWVLRNDPDLWLWQGIPLRRRKSLRVGEITIFDSHVPHAAYPIARPGPGTGQFIAAIMETCDRPTAAKVIDYVLASYRGLR